jgi:hypothetical protein
MFVAATEVHYNIQKTVNKRGFLNGGLDVMGKAVEGGGGEFSPG